MDLRARTAPAVSSHTPSKEYLESLESVNFSQLKPLNPFANAPVQFRFCNDSKLYVAALQYNDSWLPKANLNGCKLALHQFVAHQEGQLPREGCEECKRLEAQAETKQTAGTFEVSQITDCCKVNRPRGRKEDVYKMSWAPLRIPIGDEQNHNAPCYQKYIQGGDGIERVGALRMKRILAAFRTWKDQLVGGGAAEGAEGTREMPENQANAVVDQAAAAATTSGKEQSNKCAPKRSLSPNLQPEKRFKAQPSASSSSSSASASPFINARPSTSGLKRGPASKSKPSRPTTKRQPLTVIVGIEKLKERDMEQVITDSAIVLIKNVPELIEDFDISKLQYSALSEEAKQAEGDLIWNMPLNMNYWAVTTTVVGPKKGIKKHKASVRKAVERMKLGRYHDEFQIGIGTFGPDDPRPFCSNIDMDKRVFAAQYAELAKLAKLSEIFNLEDPTVNMINEIKVGYPILGVTLMQLYLKVLFVFTLTHQEFNNVGGINYNGGKAPNRWIIVDRAYTEQILKINDQFKILPGRGFVLVADTLRKHGIPFTEFTQEAGDLVVVSPGTWHMVISEGVNQSFAINFAPYTEDQYQAMREQIEQNRRRKTENLIHLVTLTIRLVQFGRVDKKKEIAEAMLKWLQEQREERAQALEVTSDIKNYRPISPVIEKKDARVEPLGTACVSNVETCVDCHFELWDVRFVHSQAGESEDDEPIIIKYCYECAKKKNLNKWRNSGAEHYWVERCFAETADPLEEAIEKLTRIVAN